MAAVERGIGERIGSSEFFFGARTGWDYSQVLHTEAPQEETIRQQSSVGFRALGVGGKISPKSHISILKEH